MKSDFVTLFLYKMISFICLQVRRASTVSFTSKRSRLNLRGVLVAILFIRSRSRSRSTYRTNNGSTHAHDVSILNIVFFTAKYTVINLNALILESPKHIRQQATTFDTLNCLSGQRILLKSTLTRLF